MIARLDRVDGVEHGHMNHRKLTLSHCGVGYRADKCDSLRVPVSNHIGRHGCGQPERIERKREQDLEQNCAHWCSPKALQLRRQRPPKSTASLKAAAEAAIRFVPWLSAASPIVL